MSYRLLMLGRPTFMRGTDTVLLKSRKGQALLLYLAAHPTASFSREHLHGLLWDDVSADNARRDFNTMLSRLRAELPVDCFRGPRGQLGWNPDAGVTTDLADFVRWTKHVGAERGIGSVPPGYSEKQKDALYRAVSLWEGPFLDGFSCDSALYEEWMMTERYRWEMDMLAVLNVLVEVEKADGRWEQVAAAAQRALRIDPIQETFHRAVMEALFHQGNRAAALAQFEQCRATLHEQIGSEPDEMTVALVETIERAAASTPATRIPDIGHERRGTPLRIVPAEVTGMTDAMPPLIGRETEYAEVADVLRRVADDGPNHVVLLHGEAGIGKTRLLSEIVDAMAGGRLPETDYPVILFGRSFESMLGVPYAVLIEALEAVLPSIDWAAINLPDVWLRELGHLLPDVFAHRPDLEAPRPLASGDDRLRLFQAVARFLGSLPQPVLLGLDDLQWADPLTLGLMAYLLRLPPAQLRLAAVVTVRSGDDSDELRRTLGTLEREGLLTHVELTNLTRDDTFTLLETLMPGDDPGRAARVYSQSHGHPLHTVELVRMLRDGDNAPAKGIWTEGSRSETIPAHAPAAETAPQSSNAQGEFAPLPVPPTVQNVFVGRLVSLGNDAMTLADALAVFRNGATVDQLRRVAGLPEADTVSGVNALIRAYITAEGPDGTIFFRHDVFRQVVLKRLSHARRTYLHRQAYVALGERLPEQTVDKLTRSSDGLGQQLLADLLAHSIGGQLWEEVIVWAGRAADVAERLYAFPAAVKQLNTMLECFGKLPATDERRQQSLDVELRVAKLDYWSPPDERDARLAAITERAHAYGATAHLPLIHLARAESYTLQGRCTEAAALLDELAPLAAHEPRLAIRFSAWRGAIDAVVGDVKHALIHLQKVLQATKGQVLKPGTSLYGGIAVCHASLGEYDKAEAAISEMEREERQQGYQGLTSKFHTVAATVAFLRGRWTEAAKHARKGLIISRATEDAYNEALCALWLGAAKIELGAPDHAARSLEAALSASKKAQTYTRRDFIYAYLALASLHAGHPEQAHDSVTHGLAIAKRFGYKEGYALCTEVQGRIAGSLGERRQAREHFTDALERFGELSIVAGNDRCRAHLRALDDGPPEVFAGIPAT